MNSADDQKFQRFQLGAAYLATHPKLPDVVAEMERERQMVDVANKAPREYLKAKGIDLSDEWNISFSHDSPLTITGCVNSWCLSYTFGHFQ
ncbi:hypothetical protein [Streptomyces sp. NRRL S-455]|uniref:hypothetical protein n=1 Tax=Streptomyces sp. NRRL S-455 TaxID=1463908 RepID=UPI0004BEF182|nr:hypothetical protein [Streptomyces sp. NRRL S-455]